MSAWVSHKLPLMWSHLLHRYVLRAFVQPLSKEAAQAMLWGAVESGDVRWVQASGGVDTVLTVWCVPDEDCHNRPLKSI